MIVNVVNDVDLDMVMAWKNGYFQFENASLQNVLKEVSRWYDVDVVYEGNNHPEQFVGEIQRNLSFLKYLRFYKKIRCILKLTGKNSG